MGRRPANPCAGPGSLGLAQALRALAVVAACARSLAAQDFDWSELLGRQDLWPAQCRLRMGVACGGAEFAPGTVVAIDRLVADGAMITFAGFEVPTTLPPRGGDVLEEARAAYAAMTEAERRLDCPAMRRRGDLWPDSVVLLRPWRIIVDDKPRSFDRGTELTLGCFDGQWLRVGIPGVDGARELELHFTDFAQRVRAALVSPPAVRPMRVLRDLDGATCDPVTGRTTALGGKTAPRFLVLYFAAAADPVGRQFAPKLVRLCNQHRRQRGQVFEVVWISRDSSLRAMQERARSEHFPWLAVRWDALAKVRIVQAYATADQPRLLVLDTLGSVAVDSGGKATGGLEGALHALGALLEAK